MRDTSRSILRSAAIGAVAGMRTFSAPAWTAAAVNGSVKGPLAAMALFETIADKTPWIGKRTGRTQTLGRIVSGGASAYFAARKSHGVRGKVALALVGAASALGATYGAFHARKWLASRFKLPDAVVGGAEDALAQSVGRLCRGSV